MSTREHMTIGFSKDGEPRVERASRPDRDIVLPGWWCAATRCGAFNGEAAASREACRCCGAPRPP